MQAGIGEIASEPATLREKLLVEDSMKNKTLVPARREFAGARYLT
ncbi:MAG: hypothetical protein WAL75_11675 [Terracidiphilus sp.]